MSEVATRKRATPTQGISKAVRAFLGKHGPASIDVIMDGIAKSFPEVRRSSVRHALQNTVHFERVGRGTYRAR